MINLVSLLVAAALVSLQCGFEASAQLDKDIMDNSLQPNVHPAPRRRFRQFVNVTTAPPSTAEHRPPAPLTLACEVMGSPAPAVRWLKNGEPLDDFEEETNEILPEVVSSLATVVSTLIITAPSSNPEDIYTCLATSGMKKATASTTVYTAPVDEAKALVTLQKLFKRPSGPRVTLYYSDIFQNIGTSVVLPCRIASFQKAQVYWQDNHENLVYGSARMRVLPSGDLFIKNLVWADMGQFQCNVKSAYGKDSALTFIYPMKAA